MREEGNNLLNLYRIMADVRAGSHHQSCASGELGIVTVWVRASSMSAAFARAGSILDDQQYDSIGTLHCYTEALGRNPLAYANEAYRSLERCEDRLLSGYDALRESALAHADGLHEVWLGDTGHRLVTSPGSAAAA
jgi:hypothetical protein